MILLWRKVNNIATFSRSSAKCHVNINRRFIIHKIIIRCTTKRSIMSSTMFSECHATAIFHDGKWHFTVEVDSTDVTFPFLPNARNARIVVSFLWLLIVDFVIHQNIKTWFMSGTIINDISRTIFFCLVNNLSPFFVKIVRF